MRGLFKKEIQLFFSSLSGYLVIAVFFTITGLFLWVLPGVLNIPNSGYASLESLFYIAPWVFLFLVPSVTMHSFSDETRTGTIELLLTRPITEFQIILAKFLAAAMLIWIALIPCLIYIFAVWRLGNPPGNLDTGAIAGAMIGLLMLGAVYTAIGTFTSALTENQVVAFIAAAIASLTFYEGFATLAQLIPKPAVQDFIAALGIREHYDSISRGVIEFLDMSYFFAVILIFLLLTRLRLQSRMWK